MPQNSFRLYQNPDGPVLGTVSAPILEQDGLFFKDLARTGQPVSYTHLDVYKRQVRVI